MTQTIHDDRAKLQHQLDAMQGELETGRAILTSAMNLLDNPRTLYEEAKTPARRVLNKAIFTKLYIDDLGDGPTVTNDELSEPFATVVYARRVEVGLEKGSVRRAALDAVQAVEGPGAGGEASSSDTDTLRWLQAELADGWARGDEQQPGQPDQGRETTQGRPPGGDHPWSDRRRAAVPLPGWCVFE